MKNKQSVRDFLGITQEEMAMVLGITKSQWSMYESGQRNIPLVASELLAEMLKYMQSSEAQTARNLKLQESITTQQLEKRLTATKLQLQKTTRKIAQADKKFEANIKALQLTKFLDARTKYRKEQESEILNFIASRAAKALERNEIALILLQIKGTLLEQEQSLLLKELGK